MLSSGSGRGEEDVRRGKSLGRAKDEWRRLTPLTSPLFIPFFAVLFFF